MTTGTTRSAARRSRFSFVWTFARTAVSLTLFAILLSQIDLNAALAAVAGARLDLLMLLLLAFVLDRVIATYRWYLLLRHRSSRVSYGGVLSLVLVSGFVGYFIPGGLGVDVLRAYGMARTTSDPLLSVSSVLVERLFGFVALALLILLGLVLQPPGLPVAIAHYAWAGLALVAGLVLALMTTQFRRLTLGLIGTIRLARMRGESIGLGSPHRSLDRDRPPRNTVPPAGTYEATRRRCSVNSAMLAPGAGFSPLARASIVSMSSARNGA